MKISKRQLKRIIREEKSKLLKEATMGFSGTGFGRQDRKTLNKSASFWGGATVVETRDQVDQNLKSYQDSVYQDDYADTEPKMEDAVYSMLEMFIEMNGVSDTEAAQMVIEYVKETLGMPT